MARTLTPQDAHALMTSLVHQATGQTGIVVTDTSSFVSAGETVLSTGVENTLNALGIVLGRTFMAVRPYKARLRILNAINTGEYTSRLRKISFYSRDPQAAGDWNTDLFTNLKDGYDNGSNDGKSTASMWEQNAPVPLEVNFAGQDVWDDSTSVYENQLKVAFRDENEFLDFIAGIMTEKGNDIESQKEAFNQMTLLNKIAAVYDTSADAPGSVINLTELYNQQFGTLYTSQQLRTEYLQSFLEFFVSEFKTASRMLSHRSAKYHITPTKTIDGTNYTLLRHTPPDRQRAILYSPLFIKAEAMVYPQIFHEDYLKLDDQHELVDYWQAIDSGASINITPAVYDKATGLQKAGESVSLDYVVGALYDVDSVMTDFQFEDALSTPVEARKRYHNIWYHFSKNAINDPTENFILFIMKDA